MIYNQSSMFSQPPQKPKNRVIYEPKGRAREYAALACNVYNGCDHQCTYCYAPDVTRKTQAEFDASRLRFGLLDKLAHDCAEYQGTSARVLLSFTCDPYQHLDVTHQITRKAITTLHNHGIAVEVLTKGGSRALRDLDLFTSRDAFASTLTTLSPSDWEPNAASPKDRMDTIRQFHAAGIPTWVSLEPVLDPATSLEIIRRTTDFVDVFKVGTLNHHPHAQTINWPKFAQDSVNLLTSLGYTRNPNADNLKAGDFYVKRDLAHHLKG